MTNLSRPCPSSPTYAFTASSHKGCAHQHWSLRCLAHSWFWLISACRNPCYSASPHWNRIVQRKWPLRKRKKKSRRASSSQTNVIRLCRTRLATRSFGDYLRPRAAHEPRVTRTCAPVWQHCAPLLRSLFSSIPCHLGIGGTYNVPGTCEVFNERYRNFCNTAFSHRMPCCLKPRASCLSHTAIRMKKGTPGPPF
ncbi:hypothetical protein BC567DRAFT_26531 [Phyllosticta citribraziliensis]